MDLGCGRGQGKKDRNNRIHGIIYLQNLRSRSDQRNDHTLQVARKFLMLAERALDSDVNPLRCRERAARVFYREPLLFPGCAFLGKAAGVWPGAGSEGNGVKIQGDI